MTLARSSSDNETWSGRAISCVRSGHFRAYSGRIALTATRYTALYSPPRERSGKGRLGNFFVSSPSAFMLSASRQQEISC